MNNSPEQHFFKERFMSEKNNPSELNAGKDEYQAPKGSFVAECGVFRGAPLDYTAQADWLILRKEGKPAAEMFFTAYTASGENRPITFIFNGGPGASSVYLHLGALGPKRSSFTAEGTVLPPPYTLIDNTETWLQFTDLVFIDPIGTGFSRIIEELGEKKESEKKEQKVEKNEYWKLKRDLESLGEFIVSYLSKHHRWESPVYIAGESYGGFRTAKLTRLLQKEYGVGLAGAVIISPALEFTLLDGSDYSVLSWVDTFPVMAEAAWIHGCSRKAAKGESLEQYRARAEEFAVKKLLPVLASGAMYGERNSVSVWNSAADFIGIARDRVRAMNGRVSAEYFVKNLLRAEGKHLGLYDISQTVQDPYPDRESYSGPDPTLHQSERVFAAGINTQLRKVIGIKTDLKYELLSYEVNEKWEIDLKKHALESQVGATDDLRYGMSLNPDMKVYLTHGYYDLVTPYFAAERISRLMKLTECQKEKLTTRHYRGGHMFYLLDESRKQLFEDLSGWYNS